MAFLHFSLGLGVQAVAQRGERNSSQNKRGWYGRVISNGPSIAIATCSGIDVGRRAGCIGAFPLPAARGQSRVWLHRGALVGLWALVAGFGPNPYGGCGCGVYVSTVYNYT